MPTKTQVDKAFEGMEPPTEEEYQRAMIKYAFKTGTKVRIDGERGKVYFVVSEELADDGSVRIYGGSTNPNGVRGYRSVMPDRLKAVAAKKGK